MMQNVLRASVLAALGLAALSAQAVDLQIFSTGSDGGYTDLGDGSFLLEADQTTFTFQGTDPALAPFTDAYFVYAYGAPGDSALLAYSDDDGSNAMNLALDVDSDTSTGNVRTFGGAWHYQSGNGDYADPTDFADGGSWSFSWNTADGTTALQTVPEPAALLPLGVGLLALARRRR